MPFAVNHDTDGVFIGHAMGLAFFAGFETAGQTHAVTMTSVEEAEALIDDLDLTGLSVVAVKSGHWKDLKQAGLTIGDMDQNELLYHQSAGTA